MSCHKFHKRKVCSRYASSYASYNVQDIQMWRYTQNNWMVARLCECYGCGSSINDDAWNSASIQFIVGYENYINLRHAQFYLVTFVAFETFFLQVNGTMMTVEVRTLRKCSSTGVALKRAFSCVDSDMRLREMKCKYRSICKSSHCIFVTSSCGRVTKNFPQVVHSWRFWLLWFTMWLSNCSSVSNPLPQTPHLEKNHNLFSFQNRSKEKNFLLEHLIMILQMKV